MLVVAVINVDAYPFQVFSVPICHLKNTGIGEFGCTELPDSYEIELGSSVKEASASSAMFCMEVCPCSYLRWCGYFWVPWVSFVMTDEF